MRLKGWGDVDGTLGVGAGMHEKRRTSASTAGLRHHFHPQVAVYTTLHRSDIPIALDVVFL